MVGISFWVFFPPRNQSYWDTMGAKVVGLGRQNGHTCLDAKRLLDVSSLLHENGYPNFVITDFECIL